MIEGVTIWLVIVIIFLFLWNRHISQQSKQIKKENEALEVERDITLEMEVANKLAEDNETFELEKAETGNWRNKI